jgi:5,10-methylenetetrahydromethanopterin reductase
MQRQRWLGHSHVDRRDRQAAARMNHSRDGRSAMDYSVDQSAKGQHMQFGIAIPTAADSWRLVRRAEELGFSNAWFFDTQMLSADPFVAMAAAAMKTTRIKLGTGVLIPSNRIAPVAATAFASLNKLAPGRIIFGVSTGFTGRRTMGLGAVKLADMEEYIRVVQALWRGETVTFAVEGKRRQIRLLNPELGLINIDDPMPLFIAASGPKARALTAKLGAGWIDNVADVERGAATLEQMRGAWSQAGRAPEDLTAVAWIGGAVLDEGEPADSPRGMAVAGPRAAMLLHRAADTALAAYPAPLAMRPEFAASVDAYVAQARGFQPTEAYYLANHRGHLMFVRPDERPFITAEMIKRTSFTGTEREIKARVAALADAGFTQAVVSIPPGQEQMIEDWGRIRRAFR